MGLLGLFFVLVVLGQSLARETWLVTTLAVVGWLCWAVFVSEFVYRALRAQDRKRFWARNWWQVIFLVVPFLRFARVLTLLRVGRIGGVLSAAIRGTRSAGRLLSSRIGWLGAVTVLVVLASSQVLYVAGGYDDYGAALHDAALSTITGQPLTGDHGLARILEVMLAVYSVVVFATLAGALGAYFLEERGIFRAGTPGDGPVAGPGSGRAASPPPPARGSA